MNLLPCRCFALLLSLVPIANGEEVKHLAPDAKSSTSLAVVVDDVPLAHTAQLLPVDGQGKLLAPGKAGEQAEKALDNLAAALAEARSALDKLVRLHLYVTSQKDVATVRRAVARRLAGKSKPALTLVVGAPAAPGVLVSADAVARAGEKPARVRLARSKKLAGDDAQVAVLPAGPAIYVSGQAEPGKTVALATRRTLEGLGKTLRFLGRGKADVAQLKAFVHPMSEVPAARKEIAAFFGKAVPPVVFVEWTAKNSIEIELVVAGAPVKEKSAGAIDYLTPTGMTASPVFCRVTRINCGRRIYTSGLAGVGKDGASQVKDTFARLQKLLKAGGSDLKHLAKATYYVSTDDAGKQLNVLRPGYYDAKRPPAASKAPVRGTGHADRGLLLDTIAVTR